MPNRMSPVKRKSSRSPEGSNHQRKALRNNSISTSNDGRKNSNANANIVDASADPRQNRGAAATVRSPVSTDGSTYQDAASSRSTPRPANMKASSAIATSHDESNGIEADDAEMKPLLDPLSMLLALVRAESEVQVSQKLAKIQLATATSELHNMKHNFPKFPSIEERMKKGKSTADQEVAKLERQLKINREAQPGLAKSLAAAFLNISSRAEEARRVPEVSPDAVTRQEFNALQDRFTQQQYMLEKQQDQLTRQQGLVDNQQKLIETLQSSHTESKNTAFQAREQANTTESEMIKDLAKLENQLQNIEASVHSGVDRVRKEMQPQLDNIVQDGNRARTVAERHETAVTQITEKLDVQGKVINQLSTKVDAATNTACDAQKGLTKLEERLTATKIEVGQIGANEQRVIKQCLREYDQKLNDLRTLVESLRSKHERVHEDLAQNAQRIKDEPKPATLTRSEDQAADAATGTLIAQMEEKLIANAANTEAALAYLRSELKDDIDAQEETLSGAQNEQGTELARTKEQLASLAQKVNGLEEQASTCSSGIQRLEQSQQTSDEKHAQTGAAYVSMRDAVKSLQSNLQMLQAKTTSLSDNVAALEKRPGPTAQMPAPAVAAAAATAAQDAAQFTPVGQLATQSPRGSNSRSGSTSGLANGVQSPRNPASPFGSGFPNGAPLPGNGIDALSNQIRGIAGNVANLKQRMDNLTTEEIFRAMSDQFISAYPGTKEFPAIVDALQAVNANLEARLDSSDSKVTMLHGNQTDLRRRFDELANRVVEGQVRTSEVEEEVTVLRKDVETNMAAARNDFEDAVGIQTDAIVNLRHQVQALADTAFGPPDGRD